MTPEQLRALEDLPLDESRSPLEPFKPLILRWRRQRRSYRKILRILKDECHIEVAYGPLYRFVQRRSRPRKIQPEPDIEQPAAADQSPLFGAKRLTPEEKAAQVEFIRSLNKPELEEQPAKPRWNFDVDKTRTIHKP